MEQCYTDVTEFAIPASTQKLYLSPVLDGFNSEIIAYNLSTSPNLEQVQTMLEQHSQRSTMRIRFSIVTKAGNTDTILIIGS
ncbi:IS3-Spn1 transposase [Streptococcus pneumoniae]|nr:IS3-Spn1 transposase [Streptococcus pneumoniae]